MVQKPYVGVTGFTSRLQVEQVLAAVPRGGSHQLMVGILHTQNSADKHAAKWPRRYPPRECIKDLFINDERVLNLVHYATADRDSLSNQLLVLADDGGDLLHGVQLNIAWPDPATLVRASHRFKRIVLQLGGKVLGMGKDGIVTAKPDDIAEKLDGYAGLITDVLIDPSGGKGRLIDPYVATEYARAIGSRHPRLGIGFAGGFGPGTMGPASHLARKFSRSNLDAEGRLRSDEDELVIGHAKTYVKMAMRLYAEQN